MSWDNILEDLARSSPGQLSRGSFRSRIRPRPQNSHDSLTPVCLHTCEQMGPNGGVFGEEPQGPWPIIRRLRTIARSSALATLILGSMSLWGQRAAAEESSGEPECENAAPGPLKKPAEARIRPLRKAFGFPLARRFSHSGSPLLSSAAARCPQSDIDPKIRRRQRTAPRDGPQPADYRPRSLRFLAKNTAVRTHLFTCVQAHGC